MTEAELMQLLAAITPPDDAARAAAHAHWASLAKPLGGLGALETLLEDMDGIMEKSWQVTRSDWEHRPLLHRVLGGLLRPFAMWM